MARMDLLSPSVSHMYGDPVRGDAVAFPFSFIDEKVLDVMLSTAPVGTRQEMRRESPGAARGSVPAFPGDILDHAVGRKGGDDTFDVAGIHAPHITRQRVVNLLTILQAYVQLLTCSSPSRSKPLYDHGTTSNAEPSARRYT